MNLLIGIYMLIGIVTARPLQAQGVLFIQQETRDGKTSVSQVQLDKTHIRAESRATGENTAFTFDAASKTVRSINLDKKTYMEINGAQLQQLQQQMTQMQEQLKNMPPQQRALMEQAMRGRGMPGMGAVSAPLTYRQTGSDKVGQWACTKYEATRGQEKIMEVCTVDPKEFGLAPSDFDVAKQLADFLKSLVPQAGDQIVLYGSAADQGFSGIPVRRTVYLNGRVESVSELKEFRRETFPASVFDVPAGFRRENPAGR